MRERVFHDHATWYVPESEREDPDPMRVLVTPMTGAEAAAFDRAFLASDKKSGDAATTRVAEEIVSTRVTDVYGYSLTIESTGEKLTPKNGAELVAALKKGPGMDRQMIFEIAAAVQDSSKLEAGARKNS